MAKQTDKDKQDIEKIDEVVDFIISNSQFVPKEKIINEFELLTSRINFVYSGKEQKEELLDVALDLDLTDKTKKICQKLAKNDLFLALAGNSGRQIIEKVKRKLFKQAEIRFVAPVGLSDSFKSKLAGKINPKKEGRVVFIKDQSLIGGFMIEKDNQVYDYSLESNLKPYIKSYFTKQGSK